MKKNLITFLLLFASAQVMAADPITPDQEQRAQKLVYDFCLTTRIHRVSVPKIQR